MNRAQNRKNIVRQPTNSRLSFTLQDSSEVQNHLRNDKYFEIKLSPYKKLCVLWARERKNPSNSKNINIFGFSFKEVRFQVKSTGKSKPTETVINNFPAVFILLLLVLGVSGAVGFGMNLTTYPTYALSEVINSIPAQRIESTPEYASKSRPTMLSVPAINLSTKVINVGLNEDRTVETPPVFDHVTGWYKGSPTPGEKGPAIILGHVSTIHGPSVFYNLNNMRNGQLIKITRNNGSVIKFRVTKVRQFSQSKFPTKQVYGNIDHAGLRLITCGGTFNEQTQKFSHNTVVFAKAV